MLKDLLKTKCDSCRKKFFFWGLYNRAHSYWLCVHCAIKHDKSSEELGGSGKAITLNSKNVPALIKSLRDRSEITFDLVVEPIKNYSFSPKPELIEAFKMIDEAVLRSGCCEEICIPRREFTNWLDF